MPPHLADELARVRDHAQALSLRHPSTPVTVREMRKGNKVRSYGFHFAQPAVCVDGDYSFVPVAVFVAGVEQPLE